MLLGSITKSAQIPFSAWLPEAIAAPTPVSTLVHSSTLVTAGVYVLVRFNDVLGIFSRSILLFFSILTIILAGIGAITEVDIKKVVALSTLRQVGIIIFSLGIGAVDIAVFHLVVHAFFKALMFMCVGGVIYYEGGFQDARFLGGLALKAPLIYLFFVSSHFSLIGFPFMSGFYSKELILGGFLSGNSCIVGFSLLFFSLVLTICYSVRIIILVRIQNNTGVVCCYYPIDFFYYLAVILMGNGAVGIGVILQKVFLKINFFCYISIYFFYFS